MAGDPNSYREDRRRLAGKLASRLGKGAKRMFFGASPAEKKALRVTKEPKKTKLSELDMNQLDRSKFDAPKKVGETIDLIDIAMGNAPAGPAPGLAGSNPPPPEQKTTPNTKTRSTPRDTGKRQTGAVARPSGRIQPPGPAQLQRESEEPPEWDIQAVAEPRGWGERLLIVIAVLALAGAPALRPALRETQPGLAVAALAARGTARPGAGADPWGHPWCAALPKPGAKPLPPPPDGEPWPAERLRSAGPDGADDGGKNDDLPGALNIEDADWVPYLAWGPEALVVLGVVAGWLAVSRGRLRQPRRGYLVLLGRALVLASLPAALGVAVLAWLLGAIPPWLPLPAPPADAAAAARSVAATLGGLVPLPPGKVLAGLWTLACTFVGGRVIGRQG